jgi:hypothetical protein
LLIDHRIRQGQQSSLKAKGPAGRDLLHDEVPRMLWPGQAIGIGPRRRDVLRAGCLLAQAFVRPLGIVLLPEGIKVPWHRFDRLVLQCPMHALVRAVLLRTAGPDALVGHAESHPPGDN